MKMPSRIARGAVSTRTQPSSIMRNWRRYAKPTAYRPVPGPPLSCSKPASASMTGTASLAGFQYGLQNGCEAAFEMDADFSNDPRYLPAFYQAIEQADVVIGWRYIAGGDTPNWSLLRRLVSGGGNIFARVLLGLPVHDCTAGYRLYRRRVLERLDLPTVQSQGHALPIRIAHPRL